MAVTKVCQVCEVEFKVNDYRKDTAKYCSRVCSKKGQGGRVPWNKGLNKSTDVRLQQLSKNVSISMKQQYADGTRDRTTVALAANEALRKRGRERVAKGDFKRHLHKRGYYELYIPGRGAIKEHHWVWEQHNGRKVPAGFHIHHKNHDRLDNRIENLELISAVEHGRLHIKHRKRDKLGRLM